VSRSIYLTSAVLRRKVALRTRLPENIVAHVLDAALAEMRTELLQQGTVKLTGLMTVSTTVRSLGGSALKMGAAGKRIVLTVKPHPSFRKRLNKIFPG
jgi:nucleoid DNA-binding protein